MSVKLRVTRQSDPSKSMEVLFYKESISIGRDPENVLQLPMTNVSKTHARIEFHANAYHVQDLKSRNATYLNDGKLEPHELYELTISDRIRICDFVIEVIGIDLEHELPATIRKGPGVQEPSPVRELHAPVVHQRVVEHPTSETWRPPSSPKQTVDSLGTDEDRLEGRQAGEREELQSELELLRRENRLLKDQRASATPVQTMDRVVASSMDEPSMIDRWKTIVLTLLGLFQKLLTGRQSFRSEFLGLSLERDSEPGPFQAGSAEQSMGMLSDLSISEEEAQERLAMLQREADGVILHVLGILEGYNKSIDYGSRKILKRLDPNEIEKEVGGTPMRLGPIAIPYRFLPHLHRRRIVEVLLERHRELVEEERGILEKKLYRPAFIQGYQTCVSARRCEPMGPAKGDAKGRVGQASGGQRCADSQ